MDGDVRPTRRDHPNKVAAHRVVEPCTYHDAGDARLRIQLLDHFGAIMRSKPPDRHVLQCLRDVADHPRQTTDQQNHRFHPVLHANYVCDIIAEVRSWFHLLRGRGHSDVSLLPGEMVVTIAGTKHYLWRAVDQDGFVLDVLIQSRRNTKVAKRLLRKLLKKQGRAPRVLVTELRRQERLSKQPSRSYLPKDLSGRNGIIAIHAQLLWAAFSQLAHLQFASNDSPTVSVATRTPMSSGNQLRLLTTARSV